jgi:N-methylhydantoinase B
MRAHDPELRLDPITFEVLRNAFRSICNQGSAVLERVAYAPAITEGRDYSVSMVTADGRFISHGDRDHTPHFGTFEATTRAVLEDVEEFLPGDAYLFSDPYRGGTHNQDIRLVRPVFWDGRLFAFMLGLCHWTDVGGPVPGTFNPNATEVYAEGIRLPTMKLYDRGKPVKSTFELLKLNVRVPADRMGDLAAQNQATLTMEARLTELIEKYGAATITLAFEEVMNSSERLFRREVAGLPDGTYEFEDFLDLDEGKTDHRPIRVHCRLTIAGSDATIDWSGSDPAPIGPQGVTQPGAISATLDGTLHCFPHLNPLNHGIIRSLKIVTRPGTVAHILPPSPMAGYCAGAYKKMDAATMGAWFQALAAVDPTRISCGLVNLENCVIGGIHPKRKTRFVSYFWMEGGQGARPYKDGPTFQMMIFAGGACNQSLEVAERWYPFHFTRFEAIPDSCGDGKFRGGFGVNKSYRLWGDGILTVHGDREIITPFGLSGGTNGAPNQLILNEGGPEERSLGLRATQIPVRSGDHIAFKSNGGGGFGDPLERDPRCVLQDVINEFVSLAKAREIYGVAIRAIDPDTLRYEVDGAETARLRRDLRQRPRRTGFGPGEVHPFGARVRVDEAVLRRLTGKVA